MGSLFAAADADSFESLVACFMPLPDTLLPVETGYASTDPGSLAAADWSDPLQPVEIDQALDPLTGQDLYSCLAGDDWSVDPEIPLDGDGGEWLESPDLIAAPLDTDSLLGSATEDLLLPEEESLIARPWDPAGGELLTAVDPPQELWPAIAAIVECWVVPDVLIEASTFLYDADGLPLPDADVPPAFNPVIAGPEEFSLGYETEWDQSWTDEDLPPDEKVAVEMPWEEQPIRVTRDGPGPDAEFIDQPNTYSTTVHVSVAEPLSFATLAIESRGLPQPNWRSFGVAPVSAEAPAQPIASASEVVNDDLPIEVDAGIAEALSPAGGDIPEPQPSSLGAPRVDRILPLSVPGPASQLSSDSGSALTAEAAPAWMVDQRGADVDPSLLDFDLQALRNLPELLPR